MPTSKEFGFNLLDDLKSRGKLGFMRKPNEGESAAAVAGGVLLGLGTGIALSSFWVVVVCVGLVFMAAAGISYFVEWDER